MLIKPKKESEFETQARVYSYLKRDGFDVRGEVVSESGNRFDLVIFDGETAKALIEIKRVGEYWSKGQRECYESCKLPTILFSSSLESDYKFLLECISKLPKYTEIIEGERTQIKCKVTEQLVQNVIVIPSPEEALKIKPSFVHGNLPEFVTCTNSMHSLFNKKLAVIGETKYGILEVRDMDGKKAFINRCSTDLDSKRDTFIKPETSSEEIALCRELAGKYWDYLGGKTNKYGSFPSWWVEAFERLNSIYSDLPAILDYVCNFDDFWGDGRPGRNNVLRRMKGDQFGNLARQLSKSGEGTIRNRYEEYKKQKSSK
jgi:hypothetical protein